MTGILHLSDLHFGTEQPPVVEALVRAAARLRPALVVLSGDITQRARRWQFRAARTFVDRLQVPALLAIPGNHDIALYNLAARLFAPYGGYRASFGTDLEPVASTPQLLAIGVNTTSRWRHVDGAVSPAQIHRVAGLLAGAAPTQLRLVVVHQPVAVPNQVDRENLLQGSAPALRLWAEAGADLVLGGHIHLPYVLPLHETTGGWPLWAVQAGTGVSARIRHEAGNSFNLLIPAIDDGARCCVVERWDWSVTASADGEFVCASRQHLKCGALPVSATRYPAASLSG